MPRGARRCRAWRPAHPCRSRCRGNARRSAGRSPRRWPLFSSAGRPPSTSSSLSRAGPVVGGEANQPLGVDEVDCDQLAAEQSLAARQDLVEHRRRVGDRARDRGENLAGGALLVERLLGLVEQAHVLEGDRRLIGERPQERDLPLAERPHLLAAQQDRSERLSFAIERRDEHGAMAETLGDVVAERVVRAGGEQVRHLDRPLFEHRATGQRLAVDRQRIDVAHEVGRRALRRQQAQRVAVGQVHRRHRRVAQPGRALGDRLEHRLHVGRRARDHAQDFADRRLLFERFLGLVEEADVLDRERRLVGEGLDQRDLLVGEGPSPPDARG